MESETQPEPGAGYIAVDALASPMDWDEGGRIHNWRNHVGEHVQHIWDTFTDAQKVAIAWDADQSASREEWD